MDIGRLKQLNEWTWKIEPSGKMNVPGIFYASRQLIKEIDDKVREQVENVAALPGIQSASYAMPDAHWGYGFCIGGVAGFDPDAGGVISAGGVGFDIACGVRTLHTDLSLEDIRPVIQELAEALFRKIPAGVGSTGKLRLGRTEMDDMLTAGAVWAVDKGYGISEDLTFAEETGKMPGADPSQVSDRAKKRQTDQVGTLGSGNHYLEIQCVEKVFDEKIAEVFGLREGDIKVSIHCGSRGLGHQIATDFLPKMAAEAKRNGIDLPERELACAPANSDVGKSYLGAMNCGVNCAIANRQVLTHLVRQVFEKLLPKANIRLLYDVSHNTCKVEEHNVGPARKRLFVHRKGATRALGPGSSLIPARYRSVGQPVLIGGTMGTSSYILVGTSEGEKLAFASSCHGAGRQMSRSQAKKRWHGRSVINQYAGQGVLIRSKSMRGIAEEAPGAYKDVTAVVEAAHHAGLSRLVAKLRPLVCVKG